MVTCQELLLLVGCERNKHWPMSDEMINTHVKT